MKVCAICQLAKGRRCAIMNIESKRERLINMMNEFKITSFENGMIVKTANGELNEYKDGLLISKKDGTYIDILNFNRRLELTYAREYNIERIYKNSILIWLKEEDTEERKQEIERILKIQKGFLMMKKGR